MEAEAFDLRAQLLDHHRTTRNALRRESRPQNAGWPGLEANGIAPRGLAVCTGARPANES
jgi:hypothetical protein